MRAQELIQRVHKGQLRPDLGRLVRGLSGFLVLTFLVSNAMAFQAGAVGTIRGTITDADFGGPLQAAQVTIVETGQKGLSGMRGLYSIPDVKPGRYTLIISKAEYVRSIKSDVVVAAGRLTDINVALAGEFTEMEEFVVQDALQLGSGSEAALLQLRLDSPALMDSIGSDLMSRAGAGDAAGALKLVSGVSVANGKTAVIRGLPDRYVSSQMNGVRMPSADEDKRAVELDQFPGPVIDSIQVSKTFTPDQQGDASGGAVNVILKSIPDRTIFQFGSQTSYNTQVTNRTDFLSYDGGGVNTWGSTGDSRDPQLDKVGQNWSGAAGTSEIGAPVDHKWSIAAGGNHELDSGVKVGGFASFFYERDSASYRDGKQASYWVDTPGAGLIPETNQGTPQDGDFKTSLFDVDQSSQSVQWGGLASFGMESESHRLGFTYFTSRTAEDTVTLAEDTRGKEYFFPGYDPNDPLGAGNTPDTRDAAPYLRLETLEYQERTQETIQLHGNHTVDFWNGKIGDWIEFKRPEIDWTFSRNSAALDQPDKRQFGALWQAESFNPGIPGIIPPFTTAPGWRPYKPDANFNLGNFQRTWKVIEEDGTQLSLNAKWPFEQWHDHKGYLKMGFFRDEVERISDQESFSNFGDNGSSFEGDWDVFWSDAFPGENHPISGALTDVDYEGNVDVNAWYGMVDLPLSDTIKMVGGARLESTDLSVVNDPEADATWLPPGGSTPVDLNPGDADVDFSQNDVLPSIGLEYQWAEGGMLRGSFSKTVARQTFKEVSPILQQDFLGGPIFIGNPDLKMAALENLDLRFDYAPYDGALISVSWFHKKIDDPIEYVKRVSTFSYTTAVNYPKGTMEGFELELRQDLGVWSEALTGMSVGLNGTIIDSDVRLTDDEIAGFNLPGIQVPITHREMTNAPEHLYNLFVTYDWRDTGTKASLFYTVQGDTLVSGAGQSNGNFVPNVFATEYDTLNFSFSQELNEHFTLKLQAKNLTNPRITEVYRSSVTGPDVVHTSYSKGIDYSIGLSAKFSF